MQRIKLMKSIPQLAKASLNTQAVNLINVVKASFDIPQDYKEHVIVLPPHFIEMMYDLYRDSMYEACESGMQGLPKEVAIQAIEKKFQEKAEKVVELLPDTAKIYEALKCGLDCYYDEGMKEATAVPPMSVLEQSLEQNAVVEQPVMEAEAATAGIELSSDAVNNMINYVNKLNATDKTALVYALGLVNYVDPASMKGTVRRAAHASLEGELSVEVVVETAPVVEPMSVQVVTPVTPVPDSSSPILNDLVPTEEVDAPISEEANEVASGPMVGIYSIPVLNEKIQNIVKSHQFTTDSESEMAVIDTLVSGISNLTIDELSGIACDKLCIECPAISDLESLKDFLDTKADEITNATGLPIALIFIVKGDDLVLAACFTKHDVAQMMETYMAAATAMANHNPVVLTTKKEVENLAGMKSLSGLKSRDLRKKAPRLAQYIAHVVADFRTGKTCAVTMANSLKRNMKDLIEACYGRDAAMYYDHLKGTAKASTAPKVSKGDKLKYVMGGKEMAATVIGDGKYEKDIEAFEVPVKFESTGKEGLLNWHDNKWNVSE
jgi:hypothetical protein